MNPTSPRTTSIRLPSPSQGSSSQPTRQGNGGPQPSNSSATQIYIESGSSSRIDQSSHERESMDTTICPEAPKPKDTPRDSGRSGKLVEASDFGHISTEISDREVGEVHSAFTTGGTYFDWSRVDIYHGAPKPRDTPRYSGKSGKLFEASDFDLMSVETWDEEFG